MLRGVGIAETTQSFNYICLRVGLAAVNDIVDSLRAAEVGMIRLTQLGRNPAHVIAVGKEARIAKVPAKQAKLPQMIGDVLPYISDRSVGTHDHLGIFIDRTFRGCGRSRRTAHNPAAFVLALSFQIEDALSP